MNVYTIWDETAERRMPLWEQNNDKMAIRAMRQQFKDHQFKDDFKLYKIGTLKDTDTNLIVLKEPEHIVWQE